MAQYVCDADVLISLYRHFPEKFKGLRRLVQGEVVKVPEGIYRELRRKSDAQAVAVGKVLGHTVVSDDESIRAGVHAGKCLMYRVEGVRPRLQGQMELF